MFQYDLLDSLKTLFSAHFYILNLISIPPTTWKQTVLERNSTFFSNLDSLCPGSAVCQISNGQFSFGKFNFIMKAIFGLQSEHLKTRIGLQGVQNAGNVNFWVCLSCRQTKPSVYYVSIDVFIYLSHRSNQPLSLEMKWKSQHRQQHYNWSRLNCGSNCLNWKTTIWNRVFALGSS